MSAFMQGMREGGWPMWFILVFGLVALGASARFVAKPERRRLGFIKGMALATLLSTLTGICADLMAVFVHISERYADKPDWHFYMLRGFAEALTPGVLGLPLLSLTALLCAVGMNRLPAENS